jgi:putative FmdB family regulatory protein
MPLYIYKCKKCLHQFVERQRFSDDPLTQCPQCEGQIRRVINSVGVVFKGSGFYVTDSRNGKSASVPNGTSAQNNTADKSEKKTDDSSSTTPASAEKKETKTSSTTAAAAT